MQKIITNRIRIPLILIPLLLLMIETNAQENVLKFRLTRGKMWITSLPNGSLEKDQTTRYTWLLMYPGHYNANNEVAGGWDATRIFNVAQLDGENVGWAWRNQATQRDIEAIEQTQYVKNYNLLDPTAPEEYMEGIIGSFQTDRFGNKHMAYELEAKTMVWGIPRYDDFVLIKCKLTNTDNISFNNFYYSRTVLPSGPAPHSHPYETEYLWDNEISDEVGFIFFDDTSWPPPSKGDSTIYSIHPGNITGDRGNPGNIEVEGSRDRILYSPFLYAFSFFPEAVTPNKFGERKVWRNILSASNDAPEEERYPGHDAMVSWPTFDNLIKKEQPKISWRAAHNQYQDGDLAGSLWERNSRYLYSIGPYDIAPGESIEWVEFFLAGQMDRNITILGDTTATLHFVEEGLLNLKENWTAAKELIRNNFAVTEDIPPPSPGDSPLLGNSSELVVEPGAGLINGNETAGVILSFDAVHLNYADPITLQNDVAGYKIYQSNIEVEGPWKQVATLNTAEADQLIENNKVIYFQQADISIPYRYAVSSFDTDGNESALSAYTVDAVTARAFSTNRLNQIRVIPNPFRQQSGFAGIDERKRIAFINIPEKCTIRIYTVALDLVRTIEHEGGGEVTWGSTTSVGNDYLLTDFAMNVSPGVYIYHVESHVEGHKGESKVGKIFIIK